MAPELVIDETPLSYTCPRCAAWVEERFYGPCRPCREQLRAEQGGHASVIEEADRPRFEPKMNVVPNHVATKDD